MGFGSATVPIPCAPAVLLMSSAGGSDLPTAVSTSWDRACLQFLQMLRDRKEVLQRAPTQGSVARQLLNTNPRRKEIDMNTFFAVSEELESVRKAISAVTVKSAVETSKSLSVDVFCEHMCDGLDGGLRLKCKQATILFESGEYALSLALLEDIIAACLPRQWNAALLNNCVACFYKLEQWDLCIRDTQQLLSFCPEFDVGRRRLCRVYIIKGDVDRALSVAAPYRGHSNWASEFHAIKVFERYRVYMETHQYVQALEEMERLLELIPCASMEALKVQLIAVYDMPKAVQYATARLGHFQGSAELQYWRAELLFQTASSLGELQVALKAFQVIAPSPHAARFKRGAYRVQCCINLVHQAAQLRAANQWTELLAHCNSQLASSSLGEGSKASLFLSRAEVHVHLKAWYPALDDAQRALSYAVCAEQHGRLYLLVAKCERALHRWKDAMLHVQKSLQLQSTVEGHCLRRELQQHLQQKQQQSQRTAGALPREDGDSRRKACGRDSTSNNARDTWNERDAVSVTSNAKCFAELGLHPNSATALVRGTYRALAMRWHPDKWSGHEESVIHYASEKFKKIQAAYETILQSQRL